MRKMTLRESHDTAWRFLHGFSWKLAMCCVTCNAGPNGEPLACAYKDGHDEPHSWASLLTFAPPAPDDRLGDVVRQRLLANGDCNINDWKDAARGLLNERDEALAQVETLRLLAGVVIDDIEDTCDCDGHVEAVRAYHERLLAASPVRATSEAGETICVNCGYDLRLTEWQLAMLRQYGNPVLRPRCPAHASGLHRVPDPPDAGEGGEG